jgi:hypothetical protein
VEDAFPFLGGKEKNTQLGILRGSAKYRTWVPDRSSLRATRALQRRYRSWRYGRNAAFFPFGGAQGQIDDPLFSILLRSKLSKRQCELAPDLAITAAKIAPPRLTSDFGDSARSAPPPFAKWAKGRHPGFVTEKRRTARKSRAELVIRLGRGPVRRALPVLWRQAPASLREQVRPFSMARGWRGASCLPCGA